MQFFTENQDQKIYIKFAGGFSLYKGIISPKDVKAKYVFFNDTFRLITKKDPKILSLIILIRFNPILREYYSSW